MICIYVNELTFKEKIGWYFSLLLRMDRSNWMYNIARTSLVYTEGLQNFLTAAEVNRVNKGSGMICCPCVLCKNYKRFDGIKEIEFHLMKYGFMPRYTCWSMHEESLINLVNVHNDNIQINYSYDADDNDQSTNPNDNLNELLHDLETNIDEDEQRKLHDLFDDAEKPLYPGCEKFSKLNVVSKLFNLKSNYGWSDKSFTDLLVVLHDMLPDSNELPISTYQAKN
ncbi:hypothetical protein R6Q59_028185 [Mikania micrantha]